ncbi:MAG: hypothetical protein JXB13_15585 [Phycisphaerae bacterium]|nr:hypothetical protein [Phycisphaerae bacterium]
MRCTIWSARRFGRRTLWVVVAMVLVRAGVLSAAEPACGQAAKDEPAVAVKSPEPGAAAPKMTIEKSVVELDPLWAGKPIQPEWVIRNTGDAPLSIRIKGG